MRVSYVGAFVVVVNYNSTPAPLLVKDASAVVGGLPVAGFGVTVLHCSTAHCLTAAVTSDSGAQRIDGPLVAGLLCGAFVLGLIAIWITRKRRHRAMSADAGHPLRPSVSRRTDPLQDASEHLLPPANSS